MKLRLGTRRSPLALAQARLVSALLIDTRSCDAVEIVAQQTTGDRVVDRALRDAGGKGLFVKELDEALADGRVDCAVHSLKDVPTELPDGIVIAAVPRRAEAHDVLISMAGWQLADMPEGTRLGTSSLRRSAQLAVARPDVDTVLLRGNVQTRLRRVESGEIDATFLAAAGLARLGLDAAPATAVAVDVAVMVPAPGQGALAITSRADDEAVLDCLRAIDCPRSRCDVEAERALASVMGGSCYLPLGANAVSVGGKMTLHAVVCSPDGSRVVRDGDSRAVRDGASARVFGEAVGRRMIGNGAEAILRELPS